MIAEFRTLVLAAVLISASTAATATTLFTQPVITTNYGPFSDSSYGYDPGPIGQILADDFVLQADSVLNSLTWHGAYSFDDAGSASLPREFVVEFYSDNAGLPNGSPIYQDTALVTGSFVQVFGNGDDLFEYSLDLPNLGLTGGQVYWLSIFENDPTTSYWSWSRGVSSVGSSVDRAFRHVSPDASWQDPGGTINQTFSLLGSTAAVPLPATTWLLISGLGALGIFGRRKFNA